MNRFTRILLDLALSQPADEIRGACLDALRIANGNRREAIARYALALSENLKEKFAPDGPTERVAKTPEDHFIVGVVGAAIEAANWTCIARALFDRFLPMRFGPLVTPSVN